jgi:hypothetical protein
MSRFWLTYCDRSGRLLGVLILDSWSLQQARFRAAIEGLDRGARFCKGHELEGDSATLVPPGVVGRMLSLEEAGKIVRRLERWIPETSRCGISSSIGPVDPIDERLRSWAALRVLPLDLTSTGKSGRPESGG